MSTVYCTLQEAYNTPSFDSAAKKRKPSCTAQARASADPYDPYLPENGRGETSAYTVKEGFQNRGQQDTEPNYRGRAADYKFYGKEYNLPLPNITEKFQVAGASAKSQCSSSPQMYEIPISPAAKEQYDNAMKTALSQDQNAPPSLIAPERKVDMSGVAGYYDEDLEQYLQTKDMKAAPQITVPKRDPATQDAVPYDPQTSPFAKALDVFKGQMTPAATPPASSPVIPPLLPSFTNKDRRSWSGMWDLAVFIIAGILILFLCEQLFKMAMLIGMKRTVDILEPFLKERSAA